MSTARHQLAGAPGTGTTIDNMSSRVKAWVFYGTQPTTIVWGNLGVTSLTDNAVGSTRINYSVPFAATDYATVAASDLANNVVNGVLTTSVTVITRLNTDVNTDTNSISLHICGALA